MEGAQEKRAKRPARPSVSPPLLNTTRLLGGNTKDVIKGLNKNVASFKTMAQSLKSAEVKSLLTKVTENSALLEVISKLPLDEIKAEIRARMHGAAPEKTKGKHHPSSAQKSFAIKELVPKLLLDNVRKVGERARGLLGPKFAAKHIKGFKKPATKAKAPSFAELQESASTSDTCSAEPLGSDVAITFKISLGASALKCCMAKEDGGAGTDPTIDPSCGKDGVSMSLGVNVAELVVVIPLDYGAPYFVLGSVSFGREGGR